MLKIIHIISIILLFALTASLPAKSQIKKDPSPILWYSPEEADSLFQIQPKPMLIDVYTEWCSWCKHMMKTTFASPGIAGYISQNFIPVHFDAESFDTLTFRGKTYVNRGEGSKPKHDFAAWLLNGRFSFPTIVYADLNGKFYPVPGYQDTRNIEPYLIYFAEMVYTNLPLDNFVADFMFSYPDRFSKEIEKAVERQGQNFLSPDTSGQLKTYGFTEAEKLSAENNKSLFIIMEVDWCNSCKVLNKIVLRNPAVTEILNKNFYTVKFNAASQENIRFLGQDFKAGKPGHPHELSYALLKQSFLFPAFITINPARQVVSELHGYMGVQQTASILSYFAGEKYKNMTYEEFLKENNN